MWGYCEECIKGGNEAMRDVESAKISREDAFIWPWRYVHCCICEILAYKGSASPYIEKGFKAAENLEKVF